MQCNPDPEVGKGVGDDAEYVVQFVQWRAHWRQVLGLRWRPPTEMAQWRQPYNFCSLVRVCHFSRCFMAAYGARWKRDDVVGCFFDADKGVRASTIRRPSSFCTTQLTMYQATKDICCCSDCLASRCTIS
jgi:hypothetical protein